MPIAVCSPVNRGPLPQYASTPSDCHQPSLGKPVSLSALMNIEGEANCMNLEGLSLSEDVNETTFSELVPSITEQDTASPVNSLLGPERPQVELSIAGCDDLRSTTTENSGICVQSAHSATQLNHTELHLGAFPSLISQSVDAVNDGLEWDDSGDLRGLRSKSSLLGGEYGRLSLPLIPGHGSRLCANSGTTSVAELDSIFVTKSHHSSFTLAAVTAEALVSGRKVRNLSSSSTGNKPIPNEFSRKNLCHSRLPPVRCSTPTQLVFSDRIDHADHINSDICRSSELCRAQIPNVHISPAATVTNNTATAIAPATLNHYSHSITGGSSETMQSLFSTAPVIGMASRVDTSHSLGDLARSDEGMCGSVNQKGSLRLDAPHDSAFHKPELSDPNWEECNENPLIHLKLIRCRDAVPLMGLLDRLEQGHPRHVDSSDSSRHSCAAGETSMQELEQERVQLDIDRSFLEFYVKELRKWKEFVDRLQHSLSFSSRGSLDSHRQETQLAIDAFSDWLSALQNRIKICLTHLNRRAIWIDQLNGFTHELKSSFAAMEERVRASLCRTRDLIKSWHPHANHNDLSRVSCAQANDRPSRLDATKSELVLQTLDNLQNLSDGVLTFQVRLGSCHLVNDCWSSTDMFKPVPYVLREPKENIMDLNDGYNNPGDVSPSASSFSSFLDKDISANQPCTVFAHLHTVNERAERLQRCIRIAIRQLERVLLTSENPYPPPLKLASSSSKGDEIAYPQNCTTLAPMCAQGTCLSPCPIIQSNESHSRRGHWLTRKLCYVGILFFLLLCYVFLNSHYLSHHLIRWFPRTHHPFCPHRPGSVVVDFSPNWWVRQISCLQLPNTKDITW